MKTMKLFILTALLFAGFSGTAQTQFWSDDFEDSGSPSSGSRNLSTAEFYCSNARYFERTNGTDIAAIYSGLTNSKFFAAADIDRGPTCVNGSISAGQSITWPSINITGKTGLSFKGFFGAESTAVFQGLFFANAANSFTMDSMAIEYRIDGGAWQKIVGIYPNDATASGGRFALDTDNNRIGDGTPIGNALTEFSASIPGTGNILDLRFDIFLNNGSPGSISIDNFRLFETPSCTAPVITANPPNRSICVNGNTTFTASATGATAYQWQVNTGSGFTDITNGGVYSNATTNTLSITGATGTMNGYQYRCTAINGVASCFTNTNNATLNISNITSSTAKNDVLCFGNSTGSAAVSPTGGIGTYTYSWSPSGGTSSIATGLAAGAYTVTITDAISCQITKNFTITQPASAINAGVGGGKTNVSCNGGTNGTATVAPTGGTPGYTYSWAPSGGTAATATGLAAGAYTVTVTDANNCQATRSYTITQPTALNTAAGSKTDVSCNGGSNGSATVSPTGGTPSYTYSWAPSGGTAATATGLTAGTYTVTVTDANACQGTKSFTITQPTALNTGAGSKTDVSCNGGSNGTATVSPTGGTPSYTYSWAPSGGTAATATGLAAGTYTVTVTDANGCQGTKSFTITQPTALNTAAGSKTDVSCNGGSNGTATVSPTGGTPSYTYSWAPSGGTAATATGLAAGTYTVTVTDANACQGTKTFTINQPASALNTTTGSKTDVSCNSGSNGTATVSPTGGTPSYTYSWAPSGGTAATATGLTAGTYTVTVTDANGCQGTKSFTITQPTALNTGAGSKTDVSCNGGSNGTATVSPTGGTPSYTYSWAPSGGTAATATGLTAGTYTVTVTDANACQGTKTFTITEPTALNTTAGSQTNVSCNGGSNGTATVSPTGGTPSYTYSWSPSGGTAATATGLAAGTYTVTVTDANGCQASASFTLTEPAVLDASAGTQTNVLCNGGATGSATVEPIGGTGTYTYSWSPAGGTGATATGLSAGTYVVTVTDANNCDDSKTFTITESPLITSSFSHSACDSYTWGTQTHTTSGVYTQIFSAANGCDSVVTLTLTINPTITNTIVESSCNSYTWAQNNMTYTVSGMYVDTIPSAAGCDSIVTLDLTINTPSASSSSEFACGSYTWALNNMTYTASGVYIDTIPNAAGCDSVITLNLTIGGSSSTESVSVCENYTWITNGMTYNTSGIYSDTLSDINGCDSILILDLTVTGLPVVTATDNGDGTLTASAGSSYQWINCTTNAPISGATAQTFAPTANGTYAVIVSNANSCSDTSDCVEIDYLGLDDLNAGSVQVFPNPTENAVTVSIPVDHAALTVTDAQGKTLYTGTVTNGEQVNLASYEDGVYFLSIETMTGKVLKRIVKN